MYVCGEGDFWTELSCAVGCFGFSDDEGFEGFSVEELDVWEGFDDVGGDVFCFADSLHVGLAA